MALIVAARFETFDVAQAAAVSLMNAGVSSDALHTFYVNPAGSHDTFPGGGDRAADPGSEGGQYGAVVGAAALGIAGAVLGAAVTYSLGTSALYIAGGAGIGAYVGSLVGAVYKLGRAHPERTRAENRIAQKNEGRPSGVLLAVHTEPDQAERVSALLRGAGGVEVERARGQWRDGQWQDFDPLLSPDLEDQPKA
ncbi:hypothetical protein ACMHYO_18450 [Allopusillimonas ginsengisoli]|uniref:hypothetical protein n=1 Tax=Allopusillimonas ginsengisoli TaxID=453575 RepID=UPI0039C08401